MTGASEGVRAVRQQFARLPRAARPAVLDALLHKLQATQFPEWPRVPAALCHVDPNILNYVRRPGAWAAVDWENSGWGDPAFEIADLCMHPAYITVPAQRWEWVLAVYQELSGDACAAMRIDVYRRILAVWWLARIQRYLIEIPQGRDRHLVSAGDAWEAEMHAKYGHYLRAARAILG